MMASLDPGKVIDDALSDDQVVKDVLGALQDEKEPEWTTIEFENGDVRFPANPQITIVTKAYVVERYDIGFGSGYRIQVAVGGVQEQAFGILKAKYCFATLYYNHSREAITIDFHKEMR